MFLKNVMSPLENMLFNLTIIWRCSFFEKFITPSKDTISITS